MDSRIRTPKPQVTYSVDIEKVNRAFKKAGLSTFDVPSQSDYEYLTRKGLTVFQWRLLNLYKKMFDDELSIYREECSMSGRRARVSGLSFRERMLKNEAIAESVFANWAERLGVSHLYHKTLHLGINEMVVDQWAQTSRKDIGNSELKFKSFQNSSGMNIYQRFNNLLRILE